MIKKSAIFLAVLAASYTFGHLPKDWQFGTSLAGMAVMVGFMVWLAWSDYRDL